jgi:hypothetical protein
MLAEDTQQLEKSVYDLMDRAMSRQPWFAGPIQRKEAAARDIVLFFQGMIDAVYEGAGEWESIANKTREERADYIKVLSEYATTEIGGAAIEVLAKHAKV